MAERSATIAIILARLTLPQSKIADFCGRHQIQRLASFGSVPRDDFGPDSDVDVLVEFEPGHVPGFAFFMVQDEVSIVVGRDKELHTPRFLSRYFRDALLLGAEVLYEQ